MHSDGKDGVSGFFLWFLLTFYLLLYLYFPLPKKRSLCLSLSIVSQCVSGALRYEPATGWWGQPSALIVCRTKGNKLDMNVYVYMYVYICMCLSVCVYVYLYVRCMYDV